MPRYDHHYPSSPPSPSSRDHRGSLMGGALRSVLNAQKLIEWLLDENDITSREEGVALGRDFIALGVLRHGEQCVWSVVM